MFRTTATAIALAAVALAGAHAQERTIITEAPSAEEYVDYLFRTDPPATIKTRGIKARGIQMTSNTAALPIGQPTPAPAAAEAAASAAPAPTPATIQTAAAPAPTPTPAPAPTPSAAQPTAGLVQASAAGPATASLQPAVARVETATPRPATRPAAASTAAPEATPRILAAPVNFTHDSADIPAYFEPFLINLAAAMQRPEAKGKLLVISGHTDSVGADSYNLELSMRRAQAVEMFLLSRGVPSSQVVSTGKGERELLPDYPGEHALNRRVEFQVAG